MILLKRKRKLLKKKNVLKKLHQAFKMNDKKKILILLKILDQIQQYSEDARNGIKKSMATICKEEGFSFERSSILYIYIFLMLYLLVINHPLAFRVENLFLVNR